MKRIRSIQQSALATLATAATLIWSVIGLTPATPVAALGSVPATPIPVGGTGGTNAVTKPVAPAATQAPTLAPTPKATATPAGAKPAKASAIVWTPGTGSLSADTNGMVKVRVSSNEGALDPTTAQYQLVVNGIFQPVQNGTATALDSGNTTVDISATVANATTGAQIVFQITKASGGSPLQSGSYLIARSSHISLPLVNVNSGVSTIPTTVATSGTSACDSSGNNKGGPLSAYVNYTAINTTADMWFYIINPVPGASMVVSLTNYSSVAGQLQIFPQAICTTGSTANLGLAPNPNPVVSFINAPSGIIYFRVVSAAGQSAPPAFNISWAYQGAVGAAGSIEPAPAPCNALPLQQTTTYATALRSQYNFYALDLIAPAEIAITLTNVAVGNAQVQVRSPVGTSSNCADPINSTNRLDPFGVVPVGGGNVALTVGIGDAGRYYIRVSTPGSTDAGGQPYSIQWAYVTGSDTSTPLFTTNPVQPFNPPYNADITGNVLEGGVFNFYWSGMIAASGGFDTVQMRIASKSDLFGCPGNVYPPDPGNTVPLGYSNWANVIQTSASHGQMSFKFRKSGGYAVALRALRAGNQTFFDEKPLRVGCGFALFRLNSASILSALDPAAPAKSPVAGPPVELMSGYRRSEQDTPAPAGVVPQP